MRHHPDTANTAGAGSAARGVRGAVRALRAEWTKLRTVPSTAWLLAATVAFTTVVSAAVALTLNARFCPGGCDEDTTKLSLSGVYLGQLAVVALAVVAATNEFATGMARTTLTVHPRRISVFTARAAVVTAIVLAGGALGVAGSMGAARVILPGHGYTAPHGSPLPSPADGPTLRAAIGTVLYLGLICLLSIGVGTAMRDTGGAVTAMLALLYVAPLAAAFVTQPRWQERIERYSPMTAGLAVQATKRLDTLPIGPLAGLGVLATYAAAAVVVGAALFVLRDA